MTDVLTTKADLRALPRVPGRTVAVMTMGALHRGHVALIDRAREIAGPSGRVIVTVFVNPRQFGAGEDFAEYPRTLDEDVQAAASAGADVVWAPSTDEVYDTGATVAGITIEPGPLGADLEGGSRPGHFAGMLTVVAKLMSITAADAALFGEKDYQQLTLIRAMVEALDFPVEVIGVPTVRDDDGLALSSRNRYLSAPERALAARIPVATAAGIDAAMQGADAVVEATVDVLDVPGIAIDYVAVRAPDLGPAPAAGDARLLVAVNIGDTRLIDNVPVTLGVG
ncbi:MAG: pantoate--beta-alanine ligase, partial [Candidatus Nanopelagicales bacterium]